MILSQHHAFQAGHVALFRSNFEVAVDNAALYSH